MIFLIKTSKSGSSAQETCRAKGERDERMKKGRKGKFRNKKEEVKR